MSGSEEDVGERQESHLDEKDTFDRREGMLLYGFD